MHVQVALGLLVFVALYQYGHSCSCLPTTAKKLYCDADFVMPVRVMSKLKNPSGQQDFDDFYRIRRIGKPWKINFDSKTLTDKRRIYTASNGAMCGVSSLQSGKKYLLSGRVEKGGKKMRISLCSSIVESLPVSRSTKKLRRNPPSCPKRRNL